MDTIIYDEIKWKL